MKSLQEFSGLLGKNSLFSKAGIVEEVKLAGDASTRQYSRLLLTGAPVNSIILMRLSSAPGPLGGGPNNLSQDDTFIELQAFLKKHNIRVPEIFVDARDDKIFLVEDIGSSMLSKFAREEFDGEMEELASKLGNDYKRVLFKKAIDVANTLQQITHDPAA